MSEPHPQPPGTDVRSFLPRPGEPVDDYAARLRALHHDLSLVLDAVERGLAAAEAEPAPVAVHPGAAPAAEAGFGGLRRSERAPGPLSPPRGGARVEVVATPSHVHAGQEQAWGRSSAPEDPAPGGRRFAEGEGGPATGTPAAPSPARWPYPEPRVEQAPSPPRPAPWGERRGWPPPPAPPAEMSYAPPPLAPVAAAPRSRGPGASPVLVAGSLVGWLTALALVLALALGL